MPSTTCWLRPGTSETGPRAGALFCDSDLMQAQLVPMSGPASGAASAATAQTQNGTWTLDERIGGQLWVVVARQAHGDPAPNRGSPRAPPAPGDETRLWGWDAPAREMPAASLGGPALVPWPLCLGGLHPAPWEVSCHLVHSRSCFGPDTMAFPLSVPPAHTGAQALPDLLWGPAATRGRHQSPQHSREWGCAAALPCPACTAGAPPPPLLTCPREPSQLPQGTQVPPLPLPCTCEQALRQAREAELLLEGRLLSPTRPCPRGSQGESPLRHTGGNVCTLPLCRHLY